MDLAERRALKQAEFEHNMRGQTGMQMAAILLLVVSSIFPAFLLAWHALERTGLGMKGWMLVAAVGGAIAGAIYYPEMKYWYVGVVPGLLMGPTILLATYFYMLPRDSIYSAELVLPMLAGLLPWGAVYWFTLRRLVLREAEREEGAA